MRPTSLLRNCALLVAFVLTLTAANAQVAIYEFDGGSLSSTDTDPDSTASDITLFNTYAFADWGANGWFLCLDPIWLNPNEQSPANASTNYLEFVLTPNQGETLSLTSLLITTGVGSAPSVDTMAIYTDAHGDNFSTRLGNPTDIYPQASGVNTVTVSLSASGLLENLTQPTTIRLYLWSSPGAGSSMAEIASLNIEGCTGLEGIVTDLGSPCNLILDPVLSATNPVIGSTFTLNVDTVFPNSLGFLFFSVGTPTPTYLSQVGCTVYVDLYNPANFILITNYFTDANGDWSLPIPLPALQALVGQEFTFQARVCAPAFQGPLSPDWLSNGISVRLGCY